MRIFMTDRTRQPDWERAIRSLRRGDHVIIRDYDHPARAEYASAIVGFCNRHHISAAIGGDWRLAWHLKTGVHLRGRDLGRGVVTYRHGQRHSGAVHSARDVKRAAELGLNLALISPVFPTRSHPNAANLGPLKYRRLAQRAVQYGLQPVALGGMTRSSARAVFGANIATAHIAAIDGIETLSSLYFLR